MIPRSIRYSEMSQSATTEHVITVPSSNLSVPAQVASDFSDRLPHLKFSITPQLSVSRLLYSEYLSGRQLEENVDIMVPIGGRVFIKLDVNPGDLARYCIDLQREACAEDEVKKIIWEILSNVGIPQ